MGNNLKITRDGVARSLKAWCKEYGISYTLAYQRRQRGWSIQKILETPVRVHTLHGLTPKLYDPELIKKYLQGRRLIVLQSYSRKEKPDCLHCGIDDIRVLTLDHINQDGALDRRMNGSGSQKLFSRLIRENFPPGFRVLCFNCNRIAYLEYVKISA